MLELRSGKRRPRTAREGSVCLSVPSARPWAPPDNPVSLASSVLGTSPGVKNAHGVKSLQKELGNVRAWPEGRIRGVGGHPFEPMAKTDSWVEGTLYFSLVIP